ncbi:serine hydrolase [Pseudonocardia phyllosphaerae]|uniref:serine hydrolase n=1 Tax=Pseudonocardia phyllosphaerae TaxID=3390502 RepID=UPI00397BCF5B
MSGFPCEWQPRFDAVRRTLAERTGAPGFAAVSLTDRVTGATWTTGDVDRPGWTASTIKLAIATDLRERGGLTAADRSDMDAMLHSSDNSATDRLWKRHGGDEMLARFRDRYGMRTVEFQPGFTTSTYWGYVKCSTADLAAMTRYVLEKTSPADRAYLTAAMRGVAGNQQWGVWSAGPQQRPGTKNGWSQERDSWGEHWVTASVGFAGPGERYVVAVTDQQAAPGSLEGGVHTVSDVVAQLFDRPVPAPVTMPEPD